MQKTIVLSGRLPCQPVTFVTLVTLVTHITRVTGSSPVRAVLISAEADALPLFTAEEFMKKV